jgi:heme-degrading monooxygenase HmoA
MIARTWRGATKAEDAEAYLQYLHETGFRSFRDTPGNLGALGLRQLADGKAVFLVVSFWESEDAIRAFAGEDMERAVFYPEDDRFLVERDDHVTHFEVVYRADEGSGKGEAGSELPGSHSMPRQFR